MTDPRWWWCPPCMVGWHGGDPTCWCCGGIGDRLSGALAIVRHVTPRSSVPIHTRIG